jgi:hypothetical protein
LDIFNFEYKNLIYCEVPSQLFNFWTSLNPSWIPGWNYTSTLLGNILILPPRWRFSAMASRRIHKTRWVLVFMYTFCNHGPLTHHWIHVSTRFWKYRWQGTISTGLRHCRWRCDRWQRHPGSTKQGEFLISCIHFANMDPLLTTWLISQLGIGRYRPRGMVSTGFRHRRRRCDRRWCYQNWQNKVSFVFRVFIFQTVTTYLPLDRCIHTDFGNIVCDRRYRRISPLPTTMLLFFLLLGVRPNRYLTYRTNINVDRRSCFLYFQSTDAQTPKALAPKDGTLLYARLRIPLEDLATCATHTLSRIYHNSDTGKILTQWHGL